MARPKRFELLTPKFVVWYLLVPEGKLLGQQCKLRRSYAAVAICTIIPSFKQKTPKSQYLVYVVGAVGIEPTTSPV